MKSPQPQKNGLVPLVMKARGAFFGAAVGDSLGWPQEFPAKRIRDRGDLKSEHSIYDFQQWTRRSGDRFHPYAEIIKGGEYSDDTQLLLSTGRSVLFGDQWWWSLTKQEIPFWLIYERGGGGSVKRAAGAWLVGKEPWSPSSKDSKRYFEAGANGVAMRIMPHSLVGATDRTFHNVARNVVANGICTHGHPRALVGALAYAYAIWEAFRITNTLEYGAIIKNVLAASDSWGALPDIQNLCPSWRIAADQLSSGKYELSWADTVSEMLRLLEQCREAMKQGALSLDREVLEQLGCFDQRIKGSGTVSAAASIFLASRYAGDGLHGLVEAAFSHGADTDTLASMTGSLVGAVAGTEWLDRYADQVQDASYLMVLADRLAKKEVRGIKEKRTVTKATHVSFMKMIEATKPEGSVVLPDDRMARVSSPQQHCSSKNNIPMALSWKLVTEDGQSLYVSKTLRRNIASPEEKIASSVPIVSSEKRIAPRQSEERHVGIRILVTNMSKSEYFYEKVLGLRVVSSTKTCTVFQEGLELIARNHRNELLQTTDNVIRGPNVTICIKTTSLDAIRDHLHRFGATVIPPISQTAQFRSLKCSDPDGTEIELSESLTLSS